MVQQLPSASLVTLPVSKEQIIKAGKRFQGHTEVLAQKSGGHSFMCMYHKKFSVVLLTTHVALRQVSRRLKRVAYDELSRALKKAQGLLWSDQPIAWLGVNPHAGEGGQVGTDELWLKDKLQAMRRSGLKVDGFFSADSFFNEQNLKKYGAAIVAYHDQGLIPFKTLYGFEGINVTLNLPFLRVSPDHGPAYELAAKSQGDDKSILYSIRFAVQWGKRWN